MKKSYFMHPDADSWKVKGKILGWAWSKMGAASLISGL